MFTIDRRRLLASAGSLLAAGSRAGCAAGGSGGSGGSGGLAGFDLFGTSAEGPDGVTVSRPDYSAIYDGYTGEAFPVLPFDYSRVDPMFLRQIVRYQGVGRPGSIVVDPKARFLYFVEPRGLATRYGVGVGREGFLWSGQAKINMRRSWPDWVPPHEMVERLPDIRSELEPTPRGEGVRGGSRSPLGARAMYLYGPHGDLGYRIHGTTEPETIGTNVSSGCIRMVNQDIIHLYGRTPMGTDVTVLG